MTDTPEFSDGPDMGGLLEQAMAMQRQMLEAQQRLAVTEVEGEAGGGVVRVVMTGDFDVRSVHIDPSVVDPADTELLADLVAAAFRHAVAEAIALQSAGLGADMPDVNDLLGGLGTLSGLGELSSFGDPDPLVELDDPDGPGPDGSGDTAPSGGDDALPGADSP
jgi:nucleoid-associated protein EbfC